METKKEIKLCKCDCKGIHQEKLKKAISTLQDFRDIESVSDFFKNFSDTTRIKILTILDSVGTMCVNDIAVALDMTKSAISHQLRYLKECNLIKSDKTGKEVFYSLADGHVKDILETGIKHLQEK